MNSSFSTKKQLLQTAWDATSIDLLKQCPRKYQLSMLYGYVTNEENIHLKFGILYHQAIEQYHKYRHLGESHDAAVIRVVHSALIYTWNDKLNRPWDSDHPNKNRFTLIRSIVWYFEQYKDDPVETLVIDKSPAVELSFSYQTATLASTGEPYILCGHLDRLGSVAGQIFGLDAKTTKYAVQSDDFAAFYSPDNQMSMYAFAGKIIYHTQVHGMIVDAAQVGAGFTRFRRVFAPRTEGQLLEWYDELMQYWLPQAEAFAFANRWPMNETSCGRYGGCPFRGICGKDPAARDVWLKASFKHREWDPLKTRAA